MLMDRLKASSRGDAGDDPLAMMSLLRRLVEAEHRVDQSTIGRVERAMSGFSGSRASVGRVTTRLKAAMAAGRLATGGDVHRLVREELRSAIEASSGSKDAELLLASVERDLRTLLQSRKRIDPDVAERYPNIARSVLQQGLADISGTIARTGTLRMIESMIREAVLAFEPRLSPETVTVTVSSRDLDSAGESPSGESDEQRDQYFVLKAYVCEIRGLLRPGSSGREVRVAAQIGSGTE